MKHRVYHSCDLTQRLPLDAPRLGVDLAALQEAYQWMLAHDVMFEDAAAHPGEGVRCYISYIDIEKRIAHPLARRYFVLLRDEMDIGFVPLYGLNWATVVDRWRRSWEQAYNILINKIPSHNVRLAWLRLGGARIGKGSSVWRNTEVLGIEGLRIGQDSCIGWHCQLDARAGLCIGNNVTVASHTLMIADGHDLNAPEFWAVGARIEVGDYAWITTRCILLAGANIGEGAVVAANTVVSTRVEPYTVVAGQGAKVVGTRTERLTYKAGGKGLFTLFH
jgi:acetyltransferase-like isoleucine patch superfamily enzyme